MLNNSVVCLSFVGKIMDHGAPTEYVPHLERVLKSFQSAAETSLSGPSRYMTVRSQHSREPVAVTVKVPEIAELQHQQKLLQDFRKTLLSSALGKKPVCTGPEKSSGSGDSSGYFPPASFPIATPMGPLFLPMDSSHSDKSETLLEGQRISCFIVGGEKRLCLPQILNTVLQDFSLQQINAICDDLHIFCSRCNPQQLDLLKISGILPPNAPSCGLITKTDAERLCNALLHGSPEKSREPPSPHSFRVYHECFGKCKGIFNPDLYTSPNAKCVDCTDCHGMFSPQKFVCHSHKALENRTCHWGFDSANWRSYLLLAKDNDNPESVQKLLDDMKDRYDDTVGHKKRRESPSRRKENDPKRARYEEASKVFESSTSGAYPRGMSAFRPWSPSQVSLMKEGKIPPPTNSLGQLLPSFLQTGPPVLLHPDRVIPFTDTKRYDRHFAPNVSLAPQEKGEDLSGELGSPCKPEPKLTCSYSTSSSSMSALSSPPIVKLERNPELELSSSDESSFRSESVPSTPRDDYRHLAEVTVPCESDLSFDRDVMLGLVKRAFEVHPDTQTDEQEEILDQISKIWVRQEDRIRALVQSRKQIIQEMELLRVSKQDRLQEMSESRYRLRQQVEQLQCDFEARSRDALSEKRKLKQEIELLKVSKHPEIASVKSKYKAQIEVLRGRLSQYEQLQSTMVTEMSSLRQQLRSLGQDVTEFSDSPTDSGLDLSAHATNGTATPAEVMEWDGHKPVSSARRRRSSTSKDEVIQNGLHRLRTTSGCESERVLEEVEEDDGRGMDEDGDT